MKSIRAQLLVTLVATAVAAGFFVYRGLPPGVHLFDGAVTDDVDAVRRSICWGVDVNAGDRFGLSPLHLASSRDIAVLLIAGGADVNVRANNGVMPLHLATISQREGVAELLIAHGADVNAKDAFGLTPLQLAIATGRVAIADLLRQHGARE
jgi:ankyrin repeat protein